MIQQDVYMAGQRIGLAEQTEIANLAGGFTIVPTEGGWVGDGGLVIEESYILRVITDDGHVLAGVLEVVFGWARAIGEQAVLVVRSEVSAQMVEFS